MQETQPNPMNKKSRISPDIVAISLSPSGFVTPCAKKTITRFTRVSIASFVGVSLLSSRLEATTVVVSESIEPPTFGDGLSINGRASWQSSFGDITYNDSTGAPDSVIFGSTPGAFVGNSFGESFIGLDGGLFGADAETLRINVAGRFHGGENYGTTLTLIAGTEIITVGTNSSTPDPVRVPGLDFEYFPTPDDGSSDDFILDNSHRYLDISVFFNERTGMGVVESNNLQGDLIPTVIGTFTDSSLDLSAFNSSPSAVARLSRPADELLAFNIEVDTVPEPSSTLFLGFSLMALLSRRKRHSAGRE